MSLADNFKAVREHKGYTQEQVAEAIGVGQQTIYKIENSLIKNPRNIKKYADFFGVSVDFFYHGNPSHLHLLGVYSELTPIDISKPVGFIPVLTSEQVASNYMQRGNDLSKLEVIPVYSNDELEYRAMIIDSDSMVRTEGISIEKGAIVIYDPNTKPINGKLVIAKFSNEENKAFLRQYIEEGGAKGFKPFNPMFPFTSLKEDSVIYGVAKEKRVKLDL